MSLSISALCARVDSFGPGLLEPLQDLAAKRAKRALALRHPFKKTTTQRDMERKNTKLSRLVPFGSVLFGGTLIGVALKGIPKGFFFFRWFY